jgi:hypothetical protein
MAAKGVDRSGSRHDLAAVLHAARNKIFLAGVPCDSMAVDRQRVAFDDQHVFVIVMGVWSARGCLPAGPKRHLAAVGAVLNVALDAGSCLVAGGNAVRRVSHELGKSVHRSTLKNHLRECLFRGVRDAEHDILHAHPLGHVSSLAGKLHGGPAALFAHHFHVHPAHAAAPARA